MLTVAAAQQIILEHTIRPGKLEELPASELLHAVLAEDIASDIDSPPFDKAMVDGYAVRTADTLVKGATLQVTQEILAGQVPAQAVEAGQ
ncbi:MAG TPA: hypothetical protein PKA06_12670, partial [Gemmatales bacterium]|nr:hypothetical protein [Gemmatales bacterium]